MGDLAPKCARRGCERRPTHYIRLLVPPAGGSVRRAVPITIGLALCLDHAKAATLEEIADERGRAQIGLIMRQRLGIASPDLSRATIEPRRLGDQAWVNFQRANAMSEGGGTA